MQKDITLNVKIKTNSGKTEVSQVSDNNFTVYIKSVPEKGKANKELIKILSKHFKTPQKEIKITTGLKSKNKTVLIKK